MNHDLDIIIDKLEGVRQRAARAGFVSSILANCPICQGKQKLSVDLTDEKVLVHCHKCQAGFLEVIDSIGIYTVRHQHHHAHARVAVWQELKNTAQNLQELTILEMSKNYVKSSTYMTMHLLFCVLSQLKKEVDLNRSGQQCPIWKTIKTAESVIEDNNNYKSTMKVEDFLKMRAACAQMKKSAKTAMAAAKGVNHG